MDLVVSGNLNTKSDIDTFIFGDGTSWNTMQLSYAVAQRNAYDQILRGTTEHDVLIAGPGDTLIGGAGHIIYVYTQGAGSVTIDTQNQDACVDKWDTLLFGKGITLDDLTFSRDGNSGDLVIGVKGTSDTITVRHHFEMTNTVFFGNLWLNRIDSLEFVDGTSISAEQLTQKMLSNAAAANGPLYGTAANDVLDPFGVNEYVSGGDDSDTHIYNLGYGHDVFDVQESNLLNDHETSVQFGDGITQQNIKFSRAESSNDLLIAMPDDGGLTIKDYFDAIDTVFGILYFYLIRNFKFSDGSALSAGGGGREYHSRRSAKIYDVRRPARECTHVP